MLRSVNMVRGDSTESSERCQCLGKFFLRGNMEINETGNTETEKSIMIDWNHEGYNLLVFCHLMISPLISIIYLHNHIYIPEVIYMCERICDFLLFILPFLWCIIHRLHCMLLYYYDFRLYSYYKYFHCRIELMILFKSITGCFDWDVIRHKFSVLTLFV